MAGSLSIVGLVLMVGWGLWYWVLRGVQQGTTDLQRRVEALEKTHESK